MQLIENGIHITLELDPAQNARLLHLSCFAPGRQYNTDVLERFTLAELQVSGFNQQDHHGCKHTGSNPSLHMRYKSHQDTRNELGRKLEITQENEGLWLTTHMQFFDGIPVLRCWNVVENRGEAEYPIEYISSFALTGLCEGDATPRDKSGVVYIPHNTWFGEAQWQQYGLRELGYYAVTEASMKRVALSSTGTWGCSEHLPMGAYQNTALGKTLAWQIETSGSWHWEISDIEQELYLQLAGPTYNENGFMQKLAPGESFTSVPCAVAVVEGGFEAAIQQLTAYRRKIRRPNQDNETLPVIFNDYMNCLMGDPTTEKLLPLIDAAQETGCEYFCIDCGWYDDGPWWDGVGEWLPAQGRFPGGIQQVIQYIRDKGMVPGLWLEIEVMGVNCPVAKNVPKDWFFQRNGCPVIDNSRYQLDFRNPEVRDYATGVVRRLVEEYGVGYIKMDYNIDAGVGTDLAADTAGAGLLGHTRAYLQWVKDVMERWPALIIENCSSGGMRMEYSLLAQHSIQSVTDQTDYIKMAAIAVNCATACTPEQAAIWSYPLVDGSEEEVAFNMVNSMLFRIHQSGHVGAIDAGRLALVKEGILCYKGIRDYIREGLPFWPTGLASMGDDYLSFGLHCGQRIFLAVWRTGQGEQPTLSVPLPQAAMGAQAACIYPAGLPANYSWDAVAKTLTVELEPKTARLFEIRQAEK